MITLLLLAVLADNSVSRSELEARARTTEIRMAEMRAEIERNQQAIERNQVTIAELKAHQTVWGTILTVLSGSGLIVAFVKGKRN